MRAGYAARPAAAGCRLAAVIALLAALAGCASPALPPAREASLPRRSELAGTPFFPQEDHQCGPAALATLLAAAGLDADPEALTKTVYLPARQGSLAPDMLGGARRAGALGVRVEPTLDALIRLVADGHPVAVLQNLGLAWYPVWHYAVVVGHDLDRGEIVLRSGRVEREVMALTTFDRTWARSERWGMVTLRPGATPPPGIAVRDYADAAVTLERLGALGAARDAYRSGLARWPDSLVLAVGLGNVAWTLADRPAAEAALRQALAHHPDSEVALNNLAHMLASRNALDEAETLARRAVALRGPENATARATLSEIRVRRTGGSH